MEPWGGKHGGPVFYHKIHPQALGFIKWDLAMELGLYWNSRFSCLVVLCDRITITGVISHLTEIFFSLRDEQTPTNCST